MEIECDIQAILKKIMFVIFVIFNPFKHLTK